MPKFKSPIVFPDGSSQSTAAVGPGLDVTDTGVFTLAAGAAVGANARWQETFTHSLGRVPTFADAIYPGGGTVVGNFYCESIASRTTTQVSFWFRLVNGASFAAGSTGRFLVLVAG